MKEEEKEEKKRFKKKYFHNMMKLSMINIFLQFISPTIKKQ